MKSGASKEGGERERESSSFWKRRLERERERIRNSLWSASDWRFCIAEADVQPLAESTFSFSSRCEACRVASRATGLVPPLQETRWLVPSLDYPDYCSNKIGGGRKEGRRGNRNLRNEQGCSRLVAIFLQEEIEIVLRLTRFGNSVGEWWEIHSQLQNDSVIVVIYCEDRLELLRYVEIRFVVSSRVWEYLRIFRSKLHRKILKFKLGGNEREVLLKLLELGIISSM